MGLGTLSLLGVSLLVSGFFRFSVRPRYVLYAVRIYRVYVNPRRATRERQREKWGLRPRGPGIRHVNRYTVHTESGSGSGSGALFIAQSIRRPSPSQSKKIQHGAAR